MNNQATQILDAVKNDDVIRLARLSDAGTIQGADRWADENGRGLLHHAAHNRSSMAMQWMLDNWSMDPDPRDNQGETPLMRAAWLGDLVGMRCLMDAGADPSAQARTGGTTLHYAYAGGHAGAIDMLAGVDGNILDASGRTAQEWYAQGQAIRNGEKLLKDAATTRARGVLSLGRK